MDEETIALAAEPARAPEAAAPAYVLLLSPWRDHIAGKVLEADVGLLADLDKDGVRYRPATDIERSIGGFPL